MYHIIIDPDSKVKVDEIVNRYEWKKLNENSDANHSLSIEAYIKPLLKFSFKPISPRKCWKTPKLNVLIDV